MSEEATRRLFLPPYQAAVDSGEKTVMISYSSWNGVKMHASTNPGSPTSSRVNSVSTGLLFPIVGGIDQVDRAVITTAVVTSINAGIDMDMVPYDYVVFTHVMKRAITKGDISMERIDDAVSRILLVKFESGTIRSSL